MPYSVEYDFKGGNGLFFDFLAVFNDSFQNTTPLVHAYLVLQ